MRAVIAGLLMAGSAFAVQIDGGFYLPVAGGDIPGEVYEIGEQPDYSFFYASEIGEGDTTGEAYWINEEPVPSAVGHGNDKTTAPNTPEPWSSVLSGSGLIAVYLRRRK